MNTVTVVAAILGITLFLTVSMIGFILLKLMDKASADIDRELSQDAQTEKVVIPQFVADWIESCKKEKVILSDSMHGSVISLPDDVYEWFSDSEREKDELFARAWLDGYKVGI